MNKPTDIDIEKVGQVNTETQLSAPGNLQSIVHWPFEEVLERDLRSGTS